MDDDYDDYDNDEDVDDYYEEDNYNSYSWLNLFKYYEY